GCGVLHRLQDLRAPLGLRQHAPCLVGAVSGRLGAATPGRPGNWEDCMRWIVVPALVLFCAQPAQAQTYPTKPIHLIVPYAPGGVADIAARIVGAKLTGAGGEQAVAETRTGGKGFIAVPAVAKAPADGYTLLVPTVGEITINPALFKDIPYSVQRDLAPVGMISDTPIVLAANVNSPFNSVADVLDGAKARPGRISIASPGNGTMNHLAIEWMGLGTGTKFQHIPYRGAGRRSEEHTSELQSLTNLVCRLLLAKKTARRPPLQDEHAP